MGEIAEFTDKMVDDTGVVFCCGPRLYYHVEGRTQPDNNDPGRFWDFQNVTNDDVFTYSVDVATFGVMPHGSSLPGRCRKQAYASVNGDPVTTASGLWGVL